MSYAFENLTQAMYLLEMSFDAHPVMRRTDVEETVRERIDRLSGGSGILSEPLDFSSLSTWSATSQGHTWWSFMHEWLEGWSDAEGYGPDSCVEWLRERAGSSTPTTPPTYPIPTSGVAGWVYNTCIAQTEKMRTPRAASSLTPEERALLEIWKGRNPEQARVFAAWATSVGLWRGSAADTAVALDRSIDAYLRLQMVVPLPGSSGNGHNYPIGKPCLVISGSSCLRIGRLGSGNYLCSNTPANVRAATLDEINMFFFETPREQYMQYVEEHWLERLSAEYPAPEIPL